MNVENNHTAETEAEATSNGSETITIQSTLGDEDEDVHKCGRCQTEFSALEAFIQHKLQQGCKRVEAREASDQDGSQEVNATNGTSPIDIQNSDSASSDKKVKSLADKNSGLLGRGHRRKITSHKVTEQTDGSDSPVSDNGVDDKHLYKVNQEGRYICQLCQKTFKTINILRTHLKTHSDQKNFSCDLCRTSFHTKGSLVRHNRRHTDERPYRCNLCGHSFRESGALTRHLKAITPCTEKIRFAQYKEILVSKDGLQKGQIADDDDDDAAAAAAAVAVTEQQEVVVVEQESEEQVVEAQTAVVSVVEAGSQEVLHQVHFTMEVDGTTQEQQLVVEQSQAEALAAAAAAGDSLICQAIINSGIALGAEEAMVEETSETTEMIHEEDSECPDDEEEDEEEENIPEVQVKEEILELEIPKEAAVDGSDCPSLKLHTCPHCNRSFKGLNYFRCHVKSHLGCKPFKCTVCEKEFLTGYLLKKHMEIHVSERRYKCGECGKLYKTIGHVREHMRAHSDERPYHCARCNKGYKTKNALQVHQRTHGDEKPYVCQFCMKGFREKGSLVRHVRHHTGEKPFKCPKCGRAFAEHGTLNRHMRAKGGCHKDDSSLEEASVTEDQASVESLTTETIISDDPHAVLVEFSSVVADTQEYIIKTQTAEDVREQEVTLIQDSQNEMGNHIMKVVQRIVSQSRGSNGTGSRQIIVRNTAVDEEGASISDCGDTITIATPESLTEQVAMTLASAIGDGTLLTTSGALDASVGTVTMVTSEETVQEEIQLVQQQEEYVITTPEEVEIQTVIV
ncbi:transcription factor E4F1 isoform X2 [Takifugu flavidus]|uniref:transcription factor E4F1 isoform X2 n=1 Tax=Takifugu flavidus TaxID=433684 RepID=UPI002544CC17|nr:transcription factor E4F1 isoform X2 [Takifugu flavidus]